jgi:hypothetical protein
MLHLEPLVDLRQGHMLRMLAVDRHNSPPDLQIQPRVWARIVACLELNNDWEPVRIARKLNSDARLHARR